MRDVTGLKGKRDPIESAIKWTGAALLFLVVCLFGYAYADDSDVTWPPDYDLYPKIPCEDTHFYSGYIKNHGTGVVRFLCMPKSVDVKLYIMTEHHAPDMQV